jgi:hypothetical protein
MASENARLVAKKVLENIGKGKKVSVNKIAPEFGYSKTTAGSGQIQKTKTYQKEIKPLLDRLEEERDKIIERLKKTRSKAKYRDLIDGLDKITKNHQLLSGKKTANEEVIVKWK